MRISARAGGVTAGVVATVAAVAGVLLASAGVAGQARGGDTRHPRVQSPQVVQHHLAIAAANPNDLATQHSTPSWLPSGAQVTGAQSLAGGGWTEHIALAGKANSQELPANPSTWNGQGPAHPATGIQLTELAQNASALGPVDPSLESVKSVSVAGVQGTLMTPLSGYGIYELDWVTGGVAYDLQVDRLDTLGEGMSGVSGDVLLRIANSMG